jgi:hypothetical protein
MLIESPEEPDEAKLDLGGGGFPGDGWRSQGAGDARSNEIGARLGCLGPFCWDCAFARSDDQVANDQDAFAQC